VQHDEYLKLAEVEDRMWYFRSLHAHARDLIREYTPRPSGILLDAGCGTGGFVRRARSWFPGLDFAAIDLFQIACDLARGRGTPNVARASSTELPFATGSMTIVTSLDVLQHIPDQQKAASEILRVLRPGGLAVVNGPAYQWLWSYHDDVTDTERRYTRGRMSGLLRKAGFEVMRSTYWNFIPLPLVAARRKLLWWLGDSNDVRMYPPVAERVLNAVMSVERSWIGKVGALPAGSSVLVAARKPA
jgi:SAM-dependent methyltransferase